MQRLNRVIIAGSRDFDDYSVLVLKMDYFVQNLDNVTVISGCCSGADKLGERWAASRDFDIVRFPAKWKEYGRAAGPIRNEEMAKSATHLVVFWDGKSKGTKSMIEFGRKYGLKTRVVMV